MASVARPASAVAGGGGATRRTGSCELVHAAAGGPAAAKAAIQRIGRLRARWAAVQAERFDFIRVYVSGEEAPRAIAGAGPHSAPGGGGGGGGGGRCVCVCGGGTHALICPHEVSLLTPSPHRRCFLLSTPERLPAHHLGRRASATASPAPDPGAARRRFQQPSPLGPPFGPLVAFGSRQARWARPL